ncbi:hypothetical protein ACP26L_36380 (plasmid) [Paenibacillus sp. S-38]|uniref:hypothetical protein n=1 Tax=Paenibacillus sp. S-38 TaxID=3416710 RepID=UPI003CE9EE6A
MVTELYTAIHLALRSDPEFLALMGLDPAAPVMQGKRIQKKSRPSNLAEENLPLTTFYAIPQGGANRHNHLVYDAIFMFDVYTSDDVALAHDISKRIVQLFHGQINPFQDVENFETRIVAQHESVSDLADSYCFSTVLHFTITLES